MTELNMNLGERGYRIAVGRGALAEIQTIFNLNRRAMVVTEPGVPREYAEAVLAKCDQGFLHITQGGEEGKSLASIEALLGALAEANFTRGDCVIAVGGGVVGDLAGFGAACYMRGIDFYNIPTTLLSQIDSSIGGKTGVNFKGVKNLIGAFHQPRAVLIDPDLLATLPSRQLANGMAEAIKMAMTFDEDLICQMEERNPYDMLEQIILRSLEIKKAVVEQDEREGGLRRVLNFGHTVGHGIEALGTGLYHGECVALGMLPMCRDVEVRDRLERLLCRAGLPTTFSGDSEAILELVMHDKKRIDDGVVTVQVEKIGSFVMRTMSRNELYTAIKEQFGL